MSDKEN